MDLYELENTLKQRRIGLAYELWKQADLNRGVLASNPSKSPKEACPELYPPEKTYEMPDFLKQKYLEREAKNGKQIWN